MNSTDIQVYYLNRAKKICWKTGIVYAKNGMHMRVFTPQEVNAARHNKYSVQL